MEFRKFLKENIVILDGGMGTLLHKSGLKPGELPELWNIDHPDIITEIHKAFEGEILLYFAIILSTPSPTVAENITALSQNSNTFDKASDLNVMLSKSTLSSQTATFDIE